MTTRPVAARDIPPASRKTFYPQPFASLVEGRIKRRLGDHFGLRNFGVNLTRLEPGAYSSVAHHHSRQDEFVYVLEGQPTVVHGDAEHVLQPGDCFGFAAGTGLAHQLVNRTEAVVVYLEIGDRTAGDTVEYPRDDLALGFDANGGFVALHKDGTPY